jgi:protocatechuate 3,4-dioxygenase beta subunit
MVRGAAISGRVTEADGAPVVEATILVRRAGRGRNEGSAPAAPPVSTDDLGEYRVGGLSAGEYLVTVTGPRMPVEAGESLVVFARTGTSGPMPADRPPDPATATRTVNLRPGEEAYGTDFLMPAPTRFIATSRSRPRVVRPGAAIRGRVLTSQGEPVRSALVRLQRGGTTLQRMSSDAAGQYWFTSVPDGTYAVEASKAGHVSMQYGQLRLTQPGRAVVLREDRMVDGIDVVLPRGTAISGIVADQDGEPIQGATVDVLQLRYVGDRLTARRTGPARRTDDYGRYRVFGLLPGRYLVRATVDEEVTLDDGRRSAIGYAPVYFPSSPRADEAVIVNLDLGVDTTGTHMVFTRSRVSRITGLVMNSAGMPLTGVVRLATSQRSGGTALDMVEAAIGPNGGFTITNVPPGDYVVQAEGVLPRDERADDAPPAAPERGPEFGMQFVSVREGDPAPIIITTAPPSTVSGRVGVFGRPADYETDMTVELLPADLDYWPAHVPSRAAAVGRDRRFRIGGVVGPARFVVRRSAESWYVREVRIGGRDVTDEPFDFGTRGAAYDDVSIILSPAGAEISGEVIDERDEPVGDCTVVVFATAADRWFRGSQRVAFARASRNGVFRVAGLPPGEYWVAAVEAMQGSVETGEWHNREVLRRLALRAERVRVGEGALHPGRFRVVR